MDEKQRFADCKCCVTIPTYNNEKTLARVITDVLQYTEDVIVVNDGATDSTPHILASFGNKIQVITHPQNQGKGKALRNAFNYARKQGYNYVITIDSDGQHFASDLPLFLDEIEKHPGSLVIGARNMAQENVPGKSSFGNKFSNFWYWVETGIELTDTQSGYRLYPVFLIDNIRYLTNRFEFEVEVIVKAAWKGIPVRNIPIQVHYEPGKERITHFRPFTDFTRISLLNAWLVTLALLYHIPFRFIKSLTRENIRDFFQKHFFNKQEPISRKAFSVGFGVFMGIFPVWGYQMIIGVALAHWMKLNKALVLVAANISIPPMIPFIIYGSYKIGAFIVPHPQDDLLFSNGITLDLVKANLFQYAAGAVALAIMAGIFAAGITYFWLWLGRSKMQGPG